MKSIITFLTIIFILSCKKGSFLEKIPDESLITPSSIEDLERLSDNSGIFNGLGDGVSPIFGEIASDNYYILPGAFSSIAPFYKNLYVWDDDIYTSQKYDWSLPYRAIFYANVILDILPKIKASDNEQVKVSTIKGRALFYRSEMFYKVAQIFSVPYNSQTAEKDVSIPIKLSSDVAEKIVQSNNKELYNRVIEDLKTASILLPFSDEFKNRPTRAAAYGLLARVYLAMQKYDSAYRYSSKCLEINNSILDFNNDPSISLGASPAFLPFNTEVIYSSVAITSGVPSMFSSSRYRVDTALYASYKNDDLRKLAFYQKRANGVTFKGSYDGTVFFFTGISTNEIYLIKSESAIRLGNYPEGLTILNTLLQKRWDATKPYELIEAMNQEEALVKTLEERRKELPFRGLRWEDLRRLNLEGRNIYLKRVVNNETYSLPPNSPHYTFLIPTDVMNLNPTWLQNPR